MRNNKIKYWVVIIPLFYMLSCAPGNRLYTSDKILVRRDLNYDIENNLINGDEILRRVNKDSSLFLNYTMCYSLSRKYSKDIRFEKILNLCNNLDSIYHFYNKDSDTESKVLFLKDTIKKMYHQDQYVRNIAVDSSNEYQNKIRKKRIDSIDNISMEFLLNYYSKKLFKVYLDESTYADLFLLMLHNLGRQKKSDIVIMNLLLIGYEQGHYDKTQIGMALTRYLSITTRKIIINFDFLIEKIKKSDTYQVKYAKEVFAKIIKIKKEL